MNPIFHLNMQAVTNNNHLNQDNDQKVIKLIKDSNASKIITYLLEHGPTGGVNLQKALGLPQSAAAFISRHTASGNVICKQMSTTCVVYSINPELDADNFHIVGNDKIAPTNHIESTPKN